MILAIRTDKPEAEIYLYSNSQQLKAIRWQAHRELASTIHKKLDELLQGRSLKEVQGIVVYKGPGSFTGLRIGISVANALAYSLNIPIVSTSGKNWIDDGIKALLSGKNEQITLPEYGRPPHITQPKK